MRAIGSKAQRGFALLIVLWTLALLALLGTALVANARLELRRVANARGAAETQARVDGALSAAMLELISGHGVADARANAAALGVTLRVEALSGKINPNIAQTGLLDSLLTRLGVPTQQAESLAAAIVDWRTPTARPSPHGSKAEAYREAGLPYGPPNKPFEHISEMGQVLGMTPQILAAMRPHLTLATTSDPDPAQADAMVLQAMRDNGAIVITGDANVAQVLMLQGEASGPKLSKLSRVAIIRIGYSPDGRNWRLLRWETNSYIDF